MRLFEPQYTGVEFSIEEIESLNRALSIIQSLETSMYSYNRLTGMWDNKGEIDYFYMSDLEKAEEVIQMLLDIKGMMGSDELVGEDDEL